MPAVVAIIICRVREQRLPYCHIKGDLAFAVHRHRRAEAHGKVQCIAAILFDPGDRRLADRRLGLVGGIEGEEHLGPTGFLLEVPEAFQHRAEIGIGCRLGSEHQTGVHHGGAGVDRDAIERGAGHRLTHGRIEVQIGAELEGGAGRGGDLIGGCAVEAGQITAAQSVIGQEVVDAIDRVADEQVVEEQGIAVEVAAAIAVHRPGVGAIGLQGPGIAIEIGGLDALRQADFQALLQGVLPAELDHREAGAEQPALGQRQRAIRQGAA